MKVNRIYADQDGNSHFADEEIQLKDLANGSATTPTIPATGLAFRRSSADHEVDWHPAPRRQYIILLDGSNELTASDGETRRFDAGDIILMEDLWGKGHLTKSVGGTLHHSIRVTLD